MKIGSQKSVLMQLLYKRKFGNSVVSFGNYMKNLKEQLEGQTEKV